MFGLGKSVVNSENGWIDRGFNKLNLKKSKLSTGTISKLCSDGNYRPKISTIVKIVKGLKS